nr:FAD-dependent oxidoreductase [Candidatus Sigynarchaeota archaeon]
MQVDLLIAGGGIAGAMAAYLAIEQGFTVRLVEARSRYHYKPCSGIFPGHATKDFPAMPESIFERDHVTMRCISPQNGALLDAREFNTILGKVILRSRFDSYFTNLAEKKGALVHDETKIHRIDVTKEKISISTKDRAGKEETFDGDILLMATGASGMHLHPQAGLEKPPVVESIIGEFESSASHVESVLSSGAYHYYLNKKISRIGPFWITARKDTFNAGIIDFKTSKEKFIDVISRDPRIKPLFEDTRELVRDGMQSAFMKALIPAAPIKTPYSHRVLALGDSAGLAHQFYYEGVWEGGLSAKLAIEVLIRLREKRLPPLPEHLAEYKRLLGRVLVSKFLRSGRKNSYLFWQAQQDEDLWSHFCDTLAHRADFRKLIVECYHADYAADGAPDFDFKAGEILFQHLPVLKKVMYAPLFLKTNGIK